MAQFSFTLLALQRRSALPEQPRGSLKRVTVRHYGYVIFISAFYFSSLQVYILQTVLSIQVFKFLPPYYHALNILFSQTVRMTLCFSINHLSAVTCFSDHGLQPPFPLIFPVFFYVYPLFNFPSDTMPFRRINFGMSEQVFKGFQMPAVLEIRSFSSSSEQQVEKEGNGKIR